MSAAGRHLSQFKLLAVQVWAVILATSLLPACSKQERPESHPIMGIYDRNVSRIELVELIIKDRERARKIKAKYEEIATLAESLMVTRGQSGQRLQELSTERTLHEAEMRAEIAKMRAAGKVAFEKYVAMQLELRAMMTKEEFERLDEVR